MSYAVASREFTSLQCHPQNFFQDYLHPKQVWVGNFEPRVTQFDPELSVPMVFGNLHPNNPPEDLFNRDLEAEIAFCWSRI